MCIEVNLGAIVGLAVSDEKARDAPYLPVLIEQAERLLPGGFARVLADGGYDTYDNFDYLASKGIEPDIEDAVEREQETPRSFLGTAQGRAGEG